MVEHMERDEAGELIDVNVIEDTELEAYADTLESELESGNVVEDKGDDLDTQLMDLINSMGKAKVASILEPPSKKESAKHVTITRKKLVTVHYRCLTCNTQWDYTIELAKGEGMSMLRANGKAYCIEYKTDDRPLDVKAITNKCNSCMCVISRWSREKLEERFMDLLHRCLRGDISEFL